MRVPAWTLHERVGDVIHLAGMPDAVVTESVRNALTVQVWLRSADGVAVRHFGLLEAVEVAS